MACWLARKTTAFASMLPTVAVPPQRRFDLGDVTLACTLAYLDFRVGDVAWRTLRPDLAAWLDDVSTRPSMIAGKP